MFRSIFELFGRSPFGPMQEHMQMAQKCVDLLAPMIQRVVAGEWDEVKTISKEVYHFEQEADQIAELLLDKPGQPFTIAQVGGLRAEGLEVIADHLVQHPLRGVPRKVEGFQQISRTAVQFLPMPTGLASARLDYNLAFAALCLPPVPLRVRRPSRLAITILI